MLAWQSAAPQPAGGRPELAGLLDFEAGMRAGRDEVLEAALRHILGPGVPAAVTERMAKQ